ncbi:hypothetical protein BC830DRAFT_1170505 [Chytriomyces sp. MP71]|nr:hypothetical protein BC830DRAFT_1170505 [Chytriomyces sp. MP71]
MPSAGAARSKPVSATPLDGDYIAYLIWRILDLPAETETKTPWHRISKWTCKLFGPEGFTHLEIILVALVYLDRFVSLTSHKRVKGHPPMSNFKTKRIVVTCLALACKWHLDFGYTLVDWSLFCSDFKVRGVACADLEGMERKILQTLEYDLNVSVDEFTLWHEQVLDCDSIVMQEYESYIAVQQVVNLTAYVFSSLICIPRTLKSFLLGLFWQVPLIPKTTQRF